MIMDIYIQSLSEKDVHVVLSIMAKGSKDIQLIAKSGHLWVAGLLWFKFYSVYLPIFSKFSKIKIRQRNWKGHLCACTCYWNTGESPGRFSPGPRMHMYDHALRHYNISSCWIYIYIYIPAISSSNSTEMCTHVHQKTCTKMSIAALLTIAKAENKLFTNGYMPTMKYINHNWWDVSQT